MHVCVFWAVPVHNRQTVTQSDRGHDPSQQEAQTVAPRLRQASWPRVRSLHLHQDGWLDYLSFPFSVYSRVYSISRG